MAYSCSIHLVDRRLSAAAAAAPRWRLGPGPGVQHGRVAVVVPNVPPRPKQVVDLRHRVIALVRLGVPPLGRLVFLGLPHVRLLPRPRPYRRPLARLQPEPGREAVALPAHPALHRPPVQRNPRPAAGPGPRLGPRRPRPSQFECAPPTGGRGAPDGDCLPEQVELEQPQREPLLPAAATATAAAAGAGAGRRSYGLVAAPPPPPSSSL
eukprot:SAG22_NODE_230_length_14595_cov_50.767660_7_plen_209_part_00